MMKNVLKIFGISLLTSAILSGCYPQPDELYYSDLDIAVTHYDLDYDFDQLSGKVCVLFDSVAHVVGEDEEDEELEEGKYDELIIREALRNLLKTNFDTVYLVKDSSDIIPGLEPDMAVTLTAWETDVYNYYYYPWGGYWYWGWGWYKSGSMKSAEQVDYYYYPWYPWGGGAYYTYTTGTVVMDMVNAAAIERPEQAEDGIVLPIIWTGIINGVASGNNADQTTRITDQIEQVFTQSPYLSN